MILSIVLRIVALYIFGVYVLPKAYKERLGNHGYGWLRKTLFFLSVVFFLSLLLPIIFSIIYINNGSSASSLQYLISFINAINDLVITICFYLIYKEKGVK